ncbi:MAG TPA: alpha/beta hydrolase [Pseudolabrys sp.]|nr:alpha/beta hydrolase [Pseudolabrys sp.]
MIRDRISLRARLVRAAYRAFLKRSQSHLTIDDIRRSFRRTEGLVPPPPRGTHTELVDAGGVHAHLVSTPRSAPERHVLYLHGGAYIVGSPRLYRHFTWRIADAARARVLVIAYRRAPEHPYPAALDDAMAAWQWLLARGADPHHAFIMGDSAGGGLTLATMLKLRDSGVPLPAAAVALSPWTDLALTGASFHDNAASDPMLVASDVPRFAAGYIGSADARDPYLSPLYGDPRGLPPTLIQAGSDEILRDDAVRMAQRMREAGCAVELQVWPKMPHVWHLLVPVLPEARAAMDEIARFLARTMA